ncbi:hypothetical protein UFOVP569_37 [uncultured Caudovirales phage]|uniref:Uncharacterized protein n=1 Tax=uncultured Caudovirales phage TaxID=2100421 RepID=A0A6J7XE67_9CAUD|nr:hypothetical protein UFOVP569_37 [uncultured Caudovirales phage]CAB4182713.1 hypothetical protein UFOVP1093_14 [uncultured Caudovirales phage]CAB4199805.1 hypothetical protein UFOVP1340_13 [uncultured Caudovirales phage]CAB4213397.1 hypothetical protein UFOVP1448_10 [uncultured Caudovirales phage]CAB4218783.1 hypothetical protein UFOVP1600_36 [uncultured Caudovirales phage]
MDLMNGFYHNLKIATNNPAKVELKTDIEEAVQALFEHSVKGLEEDVLYTLSHDISVHIIGRTDTNQMQYFVRANITGISLVSNGVITGADWGNITMTPLNGDYYHSDVMRAAVEILMNMEVVKQ